LPTSLHDRLTLYSLGSLLVHLCWREQKKGGVDGAPIALLAAGLIGQLEELEWKVSFNEPLAESFLS